MARTKTLQGKPTVGKRTGASGARVSGRRRQRTQAEASRASLHPDAYWSGDVTRNSRALELEEGVFTLVDPKRIARSLKRSADASTQRKSDAFRSAMSMLTFFINRAGKALPRERKRVLETAKVELRKAYGREA